MTQYISKADLVAEIEKRVEAHFNKMIEYRNAVNIGGASIELLLRDNDKSILSFLNTLEVKEVDLEKNLTWEDIGTIDQLLWELSIEWSDKEDNEGYFKEVLKRFKAQKGEEV